MSAVRRPHQTRVFPFFHHRTLAQVSETEALRYLASTKGRRFSKAEMFRLEILTELERANNAAAKRGRVE